jgi:arylsulfatase A-like enzyme
MFAWSPWTHRPNVLLITVDTLRADFLGCNGNENVHTPNIDALAERGILFENTCSPVPSTLPSHTSIMTGLYPHQHGVRDNGVYYLPETALTLGEVLSGEGYRTAAFVSAFVLDRRFGLDQGFDLYEDRMDDPLQGIDDGMGEGIPGYSRWWIEQQSQPFERNAENTVKAAMQWIEARTESNPFFCWIHLFDPHMPYMPPERWTVDPDEGYTGKMDGTMATVVEEAGKLGGQIRNEDIDRMTQLYAGEIAHTDEQLGRLFTALEATGLAGDTLVILTSDHGEAFGEHLGLAFEHNASVYDEVLHVPLIIVPPNGSPAERRTDVASLVDVLPTTLDALALPCPDGLAGRSLLEEALPDRTVYFEALCSKQALPNPVCYRGMRDGEWKLFGMLEKEGQSRQAWFLYQHREDPGELTNRVEHEDARFRRLLKTLKQYFQMSRVDEKNPSNFWPLDRDDGLIDRMKALGYVK